MPGLRTSAPRFRWDVLRGRSLHRLVAGIVVLTIALGYGTWATRRLAQRGPDVDAFDRPLVHVAASLLRRPDDIRRLPSATSREQFLLVVVADQQDALFGVTVLLLRLLAAFTVAGFGLVLLTAGATEWEVRSAAFPPAVGS